MGYSAEADEYVQWAKGSMQMIERYNNTDTAHGRRMARTHAQELQRIGALLEAELTDEDQDT